MAFFEFSQNNTGGYFQVDDVLCHTVIIEADSARQANAKFLDYGGYFDGCSAGLDCGCCGDRWHEADSPEEPEDGKTLEDEARESLIEYGHWFDKITRFLYANGETLEMRSVGKGKIEERKY